MYSMNSNLASNAYAELVCTSNFTFLSGASHPQELIARAAELGYCAIALTDECSLAGIVRAFEESRRCRQRGRDIKLLAGSLFRLENGSRLVLLAADKTAYAQLCTLITRGRRNAPKGSYKLPDSAFENRLDHCLALWLPENEEDVLTAHWLASHFPGRSWLAASLSLGPDDKTRLAALLSTAKAAGLPVTACGDVQMHTRPRRMLHDVLAAIRHGCTLPELGYRALPCGERHLRSTERLGTLFRQELLAESVRIARRCSFRLDQLRYQYPREVVPAGVSSSAHLRDLTEAGIQQRWPAGISRKLRQQIEHELALIADLHYAAYFLTVHDIVQFARSRNILCQGRGSAANSAVCYCLGITEVDPARQSMLFERFISRERDEPPDIDVDFEHERREEVIQYIYRKYGRERAALAATVISYRPRSAIRDVGKVLGFSLEQINLMVRNIAWWDEPDQFTRRLTEPAEGETGNRPGGGPGPFSADDLKVRQLLYLVQNLIGFPRHLSQHVGGFVISENTLASLVPVENASMADRTVIQWDKDDLETLGLLKVDCLALGMLTAIHRCLDLVNDFHATAMGLADVPAEDAETYRMIQKADTIGVFQIESRAQMAMLPRLKPACFYDLVIEVAIVRPGPIQGKMVHPYLQRRRGLETVVYPSDALRKVLQRTLGVPIFQEQVMQIAMVAAGFSGSEADMLRRSMAAWARRGGMEHMHRRLVNGMLERGYQQAFAEQIFAQIKGFGEYGFPESHAASFALLVYVSAWLKCHHPAAFACALLNSQPMGFYQPAQLVQDARRHGVTVLPVDIRYSDWDCALEHATLKHALKGDPQLRLGLRLVKGLGQRAAGCITAARASRPFNNAQDLCSRAQLNRRELAALAEAAALRGITGHRHRAHWEVAATGKQPDDLLRGVARKDQAHKKQAVAIRPATETEDLQADYAATGLTLGRHPVALIRGILRQRRVRTAQQLLQLQHGTPTRACGLITMRQRPMTANGTLFLTLEDETGHVNVVVWQRLWERRRSIILNASLIAVDGVMESDGEVYHLIARQVHDFSELLKGLKTRSRDFC
ncbi:MAG: error-prone DNA polymerase [Gammaproteobacteria bacterium]|nr:MAG: error-prone DNA polymerase [Gammaproteobacteria bacterium]